MEQYDYNIPIYDRNLAFTDLETTGANWWQHEILEFGAIITTPDLRVLHTIDKKVRPEHIENADAYALKYNGYDEEAWRDAVELDGVLEEYCEYSANTVQVGHNPQFDKTFIEKALVDRDMPMHQLDAHSVDTFTMGRLVLRYSNCSKLTMDNISKGIGVTPEPTPHRAINGARQALKIYSTLMHIRQPLD